MMHNAVLVYIDVHGLSHTERWLKRMAKGMDKGNVSGPLSLTNTLVLQYLWPQQRGISPKFPEM